MAGPGPWSVKGVDDGTRAIARAAANRAGLPIGVWLDRAILKATGVDATPSAGVAQPESSDGATPMTELEAAAVRGPTAPVALLPMAVAPVPVEPARPMASLLDIPPPSEERAESMVASPPPYRRSEVLRYGVGGALALVVIAAGIAVVDRLTVTPARPPSAQLSAAGTEAIKPASGTTVPAVQTNVAVSPHGAPEVAGVAAGPATPVERVTAQAAAGDAQAEYELGLRYSAGKDVPKDDRQAAEWFEKAAVRGLASAQYNLGVLYERGQGVAKDPKKAFFWYQSAAEHDYARAQHNLATMYATGAGVPQNYDEAARWFARAADAGITESLYSLGLMYEHGLGVARDTAKARGYYQRAAAAGSADARSKLAALGGAGQASDAASMAAAARLAGTVAPGAGGGSARLPGPDRVLDRRETAELQRLLARLDFAPGSADGVAGRRTVAAIKLYQEFAGLTVDGKATHGLLDDVRDVSRSLGRQPRPVRQ